MLNPKISVDVHLYDTEVSPMKWTYNHRLTLTMLEGNLEHPIAVELTAPGCHKLIVPADALIEAIDWLRRCLPNGTAQQYIGLK